MEHLLKQETAIQAEPRHLQMAQEISQALISEFGSKEQGEFMCVLQQQISADYEIKIKECHAHLESVKENYNNFKGNLPKSN